MIDGFRRNDYIASIRSDLTEIDISLSATGRIMDDIMALIQTCKENKDWKLMKVLKLDLKNEKFYIKQLTTRKKKLQKLLYVAEKYVPGRSG